MISLKSKPAQKILNYYFLNPQAKHYINELARLLELDPKNADRKLKELEQEGILQSEFLGKQRYFTLAKNSPATKAYRDMFLRTAGIEQQLRQAFSSVVGLRQAYIYGSYANDTMDSASDIDILAVGDHSALALQKAINPIQKDSGREINVVTMTEQELARKKKTHNPFIKNAFAGKPIRLI